MVIHSKFNPLEKEDGKKFSFLGGSVETMEEVRLSFPSLLLASTPAARRVDYCLTFLSTLSFRLALHSFLLNR